MKREWKSLTNLVLVIISVLCLAAALVWPALAMEIGAGLLCGILAFWLLWFVMDRLRRR